MSIHAAAGNNGLDATSHLSTTTHTKLIWAKCDAIPAGYQGFMGQTDGSFANYCAIAATPLSIQTASAAFSNFGSGPTFTNWNCYILTSTTPGASSANAYFQDNSGGGFTTKAATGSSITNAFDWIGGFAGLNVGVTLAYYMEWSVVLSPTEMATQFSSATPVVQLGNLKRYLVLANHTNAKTDTSGNGFNFDNILGALTDGASNPSFPTAPVLSATQGGYSYTGQAVSFITTFSPNFFLFPASGTYDYAGAPASSDFQIDAQFGSYAMLGQAASLVASLTSNTLTAASGSYSWAAQTAILTFAVIPPVPTGKNIMPNLVGLNYYEAALVLEQLNIFKPPGYFQQLTFTANFSAFSPYVQGEGPAGIISAQSIPVGQTTPLGTAIVVTINEYPGGVAFP